MLMSLGCLGDRTDRAVAANSDGKGGVTGGFLVKRSNAARSMQQLPQVTDVLLVEDESFDADRLTATLRVLFGYELSVRRAATLGQAVDRVMDRKPDIVFLDDVLKPSDTALDTIPYLRHAGYAGPIVVVSGRATRRRRIELAGAGAAEVIHKDDVDSVSVAEALAGLYPAGSGSV